MLVTGFEMGAQHWGGFSQYARVPHDWIVPLPSGLSLRESMIYGSAGLTAGLCVDVLRRHDVQPASGPLVVTGASGGVGSVAVAILAKLGYHVAAVTGKPSAHDYLRGLGAAEILSRDAVDDHSGKPMLSGRWAGGVDTVGGNILGTILRAMRHSGCMTACGLAGGNDLPITVFPFILRGITLAGIDTAWVPAGPAAGDLGAVGRCLEAGRPGVDRPFHDAGKPGGADRRYPGRTDPGTRGGPDGMSPCTKFSNIRPTWDCGFARPASSGCSKRRPRPCFR